MDMDIRLRELRNEARKEDVSIVFADLTTMMFMYNMSHNETVRKEYFNRVIEKLRELYKLIIEYKMLPDVKKSLDIATIPGLKVSKD